MKLDPILIEILSNKVTSIAEEAGYTIRRIGHTLMVKEIADFCCALSTDEGRFFAFPREIGATGGVVADASVVIAAMPDLKEGDVVVTNHPYASGGLCTHTPDVQLLVPYFHNGERVCYGWSFLHISDVGGRVPGSISPTSTELFQEGLLLPPVRLMSGGEFNPDVLAIMNANSRTPEANLGDIKAMIAAHRVAQRRVSEVIEEHGLETLRQAQIDLIEYARLKSREALRRIPDGTYDFWDYLDDDLTSRIPLRVRLQMTAKDGLVHLDYSGTDPQTLAAYNIVTRGQRHQWLTQRMISFISTMAPDIPFNAGLMENVTVTAPKGTVLNPEFPAATGVRHATAMRVNDVIHGALAAAAPDLIPGCMSGVIVPVTIAEPPTADRPRNVMVVELMIGGTGGRRGLDGVDGRGALMSSMSNNPVEVVEASASVAIREFRLRPDSGGAGEWRGGSGLSLTFEVRRDGCQILGRGMERFLFRPWGVAGGQPGAASRTLLNMGTDKERELGKIDIITLNRGDTFTVMTPGGGGYGDPFARDPVAVATDVAVGMVSLEAARTVYGVAVTETGEVDEAGTATLRSAPRPAPSAIGFDDVRLLWDAVFDDEGVTRLNALLLTEPAHARNARRRAFYDAVIPGLSTDGIDKSAFSAEAEIYRQRFVTELALLEAHYAEAQLAAAE
jgi:N-methylhydantoinase B